MIESLLLKNFQAHEKFRIDFDRITTIVGPSDVGKSSLIRALVWCLSNSPSGDAFVKTGESSCSVKVLVDGHAVVRSRSKSNNVYKLDDEEFKAFGSNVPDTISDLLNIIDVNMQGQFDAPFWVTLSAGEVSRRLNEVVDLSLIDSCLSLSKSRVSDQKKRRDIYQESAEKSQRDVELLEWVAGAAKEFKALEKLDRDVDELEGDSHDLSLMHSSLVESDLCVKTREAEVEDIVVVGKSAAVCKDIEETIQTLTMATTALGRIEEKQREVEAIVVVGKAAAECKEIEGSMRQLEEYLSGLEHIRSAADVPELFEFDSAELEEVQGDIRQLKGMLEDLSESSEFEKRKTKELATMEAELSEVLGNQCPVCGKEI